MVGGLAAVLNGAPVTTFDLDIVPARDEENVAKLPRVLDAMDCEKDLAVLPVLRRTLEQKRRGSG